MDAKVIAVLDGPVQPKKNSVRFNATAEDAALASAYVTNEAVEALGNPEAIKVTIEAA